jgi:intracellular sulfur oxidation DsrE/DsrF family protein
MRATRRRWLGAWPAWTTALGLGAAAAAPRGARAASSAPARPAASDRMPGDPPEHRVVYQLNRAEPEYIEAILNSVGAMIGRYEDNVAIAVVVFGPGIHLLARQPRRPVPPELRQRAQSQARDYGVRFVACGNTMTTLGWTAADMADFVKVEQVGASVLMELQEQGWAYIAW